MPGGGADPGTWGRTSKYTDEIGDAICAWLSEGNSLRSFISAHPDGPCMRTVFYWLKEHQEFEKNYRLAREIQAHVMADLVYDEAHSVELTGERSDNAAVQLARVKQDGAKWRAEKMLPKVYGPRATIDAGEGIQGTLAEMLAEVRSKRDG